MTIKITPTSDQKESEGTWTDYLGVKLRIARSSTPQYIAELVKRAKKFKNKTIQNLLPTEDMIDAVCKAASIYILVDWKELKINGEELVYSKENAYHLLKNDIDCRNFVMEYADEASNYLIDEVGESLGNSSST